MKIQIDLDLSTLPYRHIAIHTMWTSLLGIGLCILALVYPVLIVILAFILAALVCACLVIIIATGKQKATGTDEDGEDEEVEVEEVKDEEPQPQLYLLVYSTAKQGWDIFAKMTVGPARTVGFNQGLKPRTDGIVSDYRTHTGWMGSVELVPEPTGTPGTEAYWVRTK